MKNNISSYVEKNLCFQCGTCEAVCEGIVKKSAIKMKIIEEKGFIYPEVDNTKCISCGLCIKKCPILNLNSKENHLLTESDEVGIYTTSEQERILSTASGGMVTGLLKYLLEKKIVDKAIVAGYSQKEPTNTTGYILENVFEINKIAGSIYQPVALNQVFSKINKNDKIVIVGLPCHIRGAQLYFDAKKIEKIIKISLICTIGRGKLGTKAVLEKYIGKNKKIEKIQYRAENHPGNFVVYSENLKIKMPFYRAFQHIDYLYMPQGCLYCSDIFGDYSDITVGDPWGFVNEKKAMGIARTNLGKNIIKEAIRENYINEYQKIDYITAMKTQKSGVGYKVHNYWKRLKAYKNNELEILYKDQDTPKITLSKKENFWYKALLINSKIFNSSKGPLITKYVPMRILSKYRGKVAFENSFFKEGVK